MEFGRRPNHPFLGPTAEVRRDHRQAENELQKEVAVARNIEAVPGDAVEPELLPHTFAVDRQRRSGERGRTEWQDIHPFAAVGEPLAIPLELLRVGQEIVRRQHRLRPLQVRVPRQNHIAFAFGRTDECHLQFPQRAVDLVDGFADPELDIGSDLIVTTPPRMQFAPRVAELRDECFFDVRVNVFERDRELHFPRFDLRADFIERDDDRLHLGIGQQPDFGQHACVRLTADDVVPIQTAVERDRFGKSLDALIGRPVESPAPSLLAHRLPQIMRTLQQSSRFTKRVKFRPPFDKKADTQSGRTGYTPHLEA